MSTSYTFLPNAVLGTRWAWRLRPARSTIASVAPDPDEVGGFAAFAISWPTTMKWPRRPQRTYLAIPAMGVAIPRPRTARSDSVPS